MNLIHAYKNACIVLSAYLNCHNYQTLLEAVRHTCHVPRHFLPWFLSISNLRTDVLKLILYQLIHRIVSFLVVILVFRDVSNSSIKISFTVNRTRVWTVSFKLYVCLTKIERQLRSCVWKWSRRHHFKYWSPQHPKPIPDQILYSMFSEHDFLSVTLLLQCLILDNVSRAAQKLVAFATVRPLMSNATFTVAF